MDILRCATWQATSSKRQAKEISPQEQRQRNLEAAERIGGIVVADLEVPGHTRDYALWEEARVDVEAYQQLYEMVNARAFDVLICLNRSRLGRTMALIEGIVEKCRRANILIYETMSPPATLDGPVDSFADLVTGAFRSASAQHEIDELRRRHSFGMFGRFKKGEFLNRVPWGWRAVYDDKGKATLVLDEAAALTIRTALVTLYCEQGMGSTFIVKELNQRKMYTAQGLKWTLKSLDYLFRMVWRYAGIAEINHYSRKRPYARGKGNWPAILTEEEVHRILEERASRRGKRGKDTATYRFSLMVYCLHCGERMIMQYKASPRDNSRRWVSAECRSGKHKSGRFAPIRMIHEEVSDFIESLQDESNWGMFLADNSRDASSVENKIASVTKSIRDVEQNILRADDKLIDGTLDEARHAHQVRRLKEQIENYRHELTILEERRAAIDHASNKRDRIRELAERGAEYLTMADERAANAKLRPLLRIWVKGPSVERFDIL